MAFEAPIITPLQRVLPAWIDYNGHMNMAFYSLAFDRALDAVFNTIGIGEEHLRAGEGSCFTLETHVTYLREVKENDPLRITLQLLDHDQKCLHIMEHMLHDTEGYLAATSEQMLLHVSMKTRRAAPFPEAVQNTLRDIHKAHQSLPRPPQTGHVIGIRRKTAATA